MMNSNRLMWLVYALLGLVILLPLLLPGFVLTLDMVFVPHPPIPLNVTSSYLFHTALHFLSYVIPGDVLQKIILFSIVLFSGIGMHKLALYFFDRMATSTQAAAYVGGILYVVNPFVYGRFMAGQYAVLLGYMLLPFLVRALLRFLENPTGRHMAGVAGLVLLISIVSIHTVGLAVVFTIPALAVALWRKRSSRTYVMAVLKYGSIGSAVVVLLSSYWLLPLIQGRGKVAEQIDGFSGVDRLAFATDGGIWQVLQLKGFWVEAQGLFMPAGDPLPLTGLAQVVLWAVVGVGVVYLWRHYRHLAILWIAVAILAVGLALGILSDWLAAHISLFAGYREPHKFAALLALSYGVFASFGALSVLAKVKQWKAGKYLTLAGLLILPFWITPAMVWGLGGQLSPRQYPPDWYAAREFLERDEDDSRVLFLPWHLYMRFNFTDRIIAQPADRFFDHSVVISQDPEFAGLKPVSKNYEVRVLSGEILPSASTTSTLGARLAPLKIKYVFLAKDADYRKYQYLDKQRDLRLIRETESLKIYQNAAYKSEVKHANN